MPGGVSSWAQDLLLSQPQLSFDVVAILPPGAHPKLVYELPKNVVKLTNIWLQELRPNDKPLPKKLAEDFYPKIELALLHVSSEPSLDLLRHLTAALRSLPEVPGKEILLNSRQVWSIILRMYRTMMGESCFLDYFWSWRALFGGLLSILMSELPISRVYHSISTGYAGLFLTRAGLETGMPCMLTEHGIYTNERRIEINMADWLPDSKALNFNIEKELGEKTLRDFWVDCFSSYSKMTYEISETIITLFEGNYEYQIKDGADKRKLRVIPNGIDFKKFGSLPQKQSGSPTIALIGRVVPIKDVKTFIRACALVSSNFLGFKGLIIGPYEEDPDYYAECTDLVRNLALQDVIEFTGKKNLTDVMSLIDLVVLTSISEAMPLVVLEAGAAGIPTVSTNVGACHEMIFGRSDENPQLGQAGIITELANPVDTAKAIKLLLTDQEKRLNYGNIMRKRVEIYYDIELQKNAYSELYASMLKLSAEREHEQAAAVSTTG